MKRADDSGRQGSRLAARLLSMAWLVLTAASTLLAADKPDIVIIVADDLGWADVSLHGQEIKTPNIDRLAREGVELNRFYVCPVCSPTRAGLMTGRYPIRFGLMRSVVPPWRKGGLDVSEVTLPEVLAKAGYRHRGVFGKWHLGHSSVKYHPLRRGFTEFVGHYNGAIDYFTHEREGELDWHHDYESNRDKGYSTDLIAAAAVDFIDRHAKEESPFLCYVPFNSPHGPLQAKAKDLESYASLAQRRPLFNQQSERRRQNRRAYGQQGHGKSRRQTLAAMISSLDDGVGKILDALEKHGIAKNTLVWFFSDNGGTGVGDNRPLRGAKGSVFEGGTRVAAALRWPARVPAGRKVTAPLAYIDVLPTLMRIVGVDDHGGKPLDGISALDVVTGAEREITREIYSYIGQAGEAAEKIALIEPEWKLVANGPKITDTEARGQRDVLLFRIASDPYEKSNVAAENKTVVDRMLAKLKKFRDLQPADAVAPYRQRDRAFKAPKDWRIPER